jgi:hypothetical protein
MTVERTPEPHHPTREASGPSDRAFGLTFAGVFTVLALLPLLRGGHARTWMLGLAAAFLAVALARPGLLAPLNRVWLRIGLVLHRVVNPVVLAVVFYCAVTPVALLMRLAGSRPLKLGFDRDARSYWTPREPPGPDSQTMTRQF